MTSSVPMDVAFVELRRGLQKAHYSQPLGIESFALVSKLFDDVQVSTNPAISYFLDSMG